MNKWRLLTILFVFAFIPIVLAIQQVDSEGIIITSDLETYFCEPVISPEGCLINTMLTVQNNRGSSINALFEFDSNRNVYVRDFITQGQRRALDRSEGKNIKSLNRKQIQAGETEYINLNFYVKENGKFNFSIEFAGTRVVLDPYYNLSFNSSPSTHLEDSVVDVDPDSSFSQTDITGGLIDGSDGTTYLTTLGSAAQKKINYTDGVPDSWDYLATDSDIAAVDFDISDKPLIIGNTISVCYVAGDNSAALLSNATINNTHIPIQFNLPLTSTPTECHYAHIPVSYLTTGTNRIGFRCIGCSPKRLYIGTDNAQTNLTSWFWDGATWTRQLTNDYGIHINYTKTDLTTGKAIKVNFNLSTDSDNDYWLRTRKTTSGVSNVTIYTYKGNNDNINTSNTLSRTVTTGWDIIPLNPIIYDNYFADFRFYTKTSNSFSEVQLIEQVEDNDSPVINSNSINDSALLCDNSPIRLLSNVTDNEILDTVFFGYEDTASHNEEADRIIDTDLFYIDLSYSHDTDGVTETYNWTFINATDIVGLSATANPSLSWTYTCDIDSESPTSTLVSPANNTVTNETSVSFSFSATDDVGLKNATLRHNITGTLIDVLSTTLTGTSDSDSINDNIPYNNTIIWEIKICDLVGNCVSSDQWFLTTNQTFGEIIPPEPPAPPPVFLITLIKPYNASIVASFRVNYTFTTNMSGDYTLNVDQGTGFEAIETISADIQGSFIQYYFQNLSIDWFVNGSGESSETWSFNTSYTTQLAEAIDELDSLTIPKILLLIFLLLFGFGFLFLCLYSNIRELVVLSALVQFIVAIGMFVILPSSYLLGYLVGSIFIGLGFLCFAKFLTESDLFNH